MKNFKLIIVSIILLLMTILGGAALLKDEYVVNMNKKFKNSIKTNKVVTKRAIMIDDKIYYDTGDKSNIEVRCGMMDGTIDKVSVRSDELPYENNQANFVGE